MFRLHRSIDTIYKSVETETKPYSWPSPLYWLICMLHSPCCFYLPVIILHNHLIYISTFPLEHEYFKRMWGLGLANDKEYMTRNACLTLKQLFERHYPVPITCYTSSWLTHHMTFKCPWEFYFLFLSMIKLNHEHMIYTC